jgi:hypothetical protein
VEVTIRRSRPEDAEGIHHCLDVVARERRHIAPVEGPGVERVRAFIASFPERSVIQHVVVDGRTEDILCMALLLPPLGEGARRARRRPGLRAPRHPRGRPPESPRPCARDLPPIPETTFQARHTLPDAVRYPAAMARVQILYCET